MISLDLVVTRRDSSVVLFFWRLSPPERNLCFTVFLAMVAAGEGLLCFVFLDLSGMLQAETEDYNADDWAKDKWYVKARALRHIAIS